MHTLLRPMAYAITLLLFGCGLATATDNTASQEGIAAYYHDRFQGKTTASGEPYDRHALTAAHRSYPMGTRLAVTNLKNQRQVVVRINDRGPQSAKRILDVSRRAAEELGFIRDGLARVKIRVLE